MNNIQKRINKILNDNRKKIVKKAKKEYTKEDIFNLITKSDFPKALDDNKKSFIHVLNLMMEDVPDGLTSEKFQKDLDDLLEDAYATTLSDMLLAQDDSDEADEEFCKDETYEYCKEELFGKTPEDRATFIMDYFDDEAPEGISEYR